MMPPTNLVHMTTATLLVVRIPRESLTLYPGCGSLMLPPRGLEFLVTLTPSKPSVLSDLGAAAVAGAAVASGATSALLGNPIVAMQQNTIVAVTELSICAFSDIDPVGPIDFGFGDDVGRSYRGSVVLFAGMLVVVETLLVLMLGIVAAVKARRSGSFRYSFIEVSSVVHFPGVLVVPFVSTFQPALIAAVSLIRLQLSVMDLLLAASAIVLSIVGFGLALGVAKPWFRCCLGEPQRETPLDFEAKVPHLLHVLAYIEWKMEWTDLSDNHFKKRYMNVFDGFVLPWYPVVEMVSTGLQGLILGIRINRFAVCAAQCFSLFAINGITLVIVARMRPAGSRFNQHCLLLGKVLVQVLCGLTTANSYLGNLDSVVGWVSTMSTMLGNFQTLVGLTLLCLTTARYMKRHGMVGMKQGAADEQPKTINVVMIVETAEDPFFGNIIGEAIELEPVPPPEPVEEQPPPPPPPPPVVAEPIIPDAIDDSYFDGLTEEQLAALSPKQKIAFEKFLVQREKLVQELMQGLSAGGFARAQVPGGPAARSSAHRSKPDASGNVDDFPYQSLLDPLCETEKSEGERNTPDADELL